jgi:peroxiredoxin Q/BCP
MSAFRDLAAKFADANAQVLGVSTDDVATQKKFADSLKLPFPLLADSDKKMAAAYGVLVDEGYADRVTFVIDKAGRIVKVLDGKDALDPNPALGACPIHRDGSL